MKKPPTIYLDTQDFSRFGDVLRGKSDQKWETLFIELERRKAAGDVIFAQSMPLLAELLQYDADFRDTTFRKAEAVERLCGPWALAFHSRLFAAELADAAFERDLINQARTVPIISDDRYWFPNVSDQFAGLKQRMKTAVSLEVTAMEGLTRQQRRQAKTRAKKVDYRKLAREAAPAMAAELGLPEEAIEASVVALLSGKTSAAEASRRLFGAIAEPQKFVEAYFERYESDRALPLWMRGIGESFHDRFADFVTWVGPIMDLETGPVALDQAIKEWPTSFGRSALETADDDAIEFGLSAELFEQLIADDSVVASIPSSRIIGRTLVAYMRQVSGLAGSIAKVEHSFGGDLVHALYLPHVDLWRGDRRFSAMIAAAVPEYATRIVSRLSDLPNAIDRWLGSPQTDTPALGAL